MNFDEERMGKRGVLLIHAGAIGDVLLVRPVLHVLRRQFPQHEIALMANQAVGLLLRDGREIDRIFPLESSYLTELFAGHDCVRPVFRSWLSTCDVAAGWLRDDREGTVAETLRILGVQHVMVKSPSSPDLLSEHQTARYLEAIDMQDVSMTDDRPLMLSPSARQRGRQILQTLNWTNQRRLAVIHPGSGSIHKCMEAPRLARVIEWLHQEATIPMLLEGPSDRESVARVLAAATVAVPVIRGCDLSTVAGLLTYADFYLGHDSGMTHLAAALAIPTIVCFGPTNPRRWSPLGRGVAILTGAPCSCQTWSCVEHCPERVCLHIAPERVIEACRALLMRQSSAPIV